jgi:hypothetical protein
MNLVGASAVPHILQLIMLLFVLNGALVLKTNANSQLSALKEKKCSVWMTHLRI